MTLDCFDVVVIGAGPAGSAAAIRLCQVNPALRVAVVDKAVFPRDKACGDGLGPGVAPLLKRLGADIAEIPHANVFRRAEVHGPDGTSFVVEMPEMFGSAVGMTARRIDFDHLLFRRARDVGAVVIEGVRFVGFEVSENAAEVKLRGVNDRHERTLRCHLVVGADGANSRVRRAAGIDSPPPHKTGIALRAYTKVSQARRDRIVVSFEDHLIPGYGWYFPFADGTANVGVGMELRDYRRRRPDLAALLDDHLTVLNSRGIQADNPTDLSTYTLPTNSKPAALVGPRLALVGDAASLVNPFTGEGVVYGMAAGIALAESVACSLGDTAGLHTALGQFNKQIRRQYSAHFFSNYVAHRAMRRPLLARTIIAAISASPRLQVSSIALMFGDNRLSAGDIMRVVGYGAAPMAQTLARSANSKRQRDLPGHEAETAQNTPPTQQHTAAREDDPAPPLSPDGSQSTRPT